MWWLQWRKARISAFHSWWKVWCILSVLLKTNVIMVQVLLNSNNNSVSRVLLAHVHFYWSVKKSFICTFLLILLQLDAGLLLLFESPCLHVSSCAGILLPFMVELPGFWHFSCDTCCPSGWSSPVSIRSFSSFMCFSIGWSLEVFIHFVANKMSFWSTFG